MSAAAHPGALDGLVGPVDSAVRRLRPQVTVACALGFVVAVVATPREAVWAFGVHGALVGTVAVLARIPPGTLLRRLSVELWFVAFAVALPFLGSGPRTDVMGLSLSVEGLWAAWAIVAKGTLGVAAAVLVAWSTPVADVLVGLERLRVPGAFVAIAGFMVRYVDLVVADLRRLQVARVSRGDDPRWLGQTRTVAATLGTQFVRTYERGERVQQAMLARGFDGRFPGPALDPLPPRWWPAVAVPGAAWVVAGAALAST